MSQNPEKHHIQKRPICCTGLRNYVKSRSNLSCLLAFNCLFFTSLMSYSQVTVFLDIPFFRRRMPSPILLKMFNPSERFGSNQLRGCALCKMINSFPSFYHIFPSFFDIIFAEFVNSRNPHKLLENY